MVVLLTVHLSINLVTDQRNAQILDVLLAVQLSIFISVILLLFAHIYRIVF